MLSPFVTPHLSHRICHTAFVTPHFSHRICHTAFFPMHHSRLSELDSQDGPAALVLDSPKPRALCKPIDGVTRLRMEKAKRTNDRATELEGEDGDEQQADEQAIHSLPFPSTCHSAFPPTCHSAFPPTCHRRLLQALQILHETLGRFESGEPAERRLLEADQHEPREEWLASWHAQLKCWILALPLPTRAQLHSCMGALGLHLGSRLASLWHASPPTLEGGAISPECAWIEQPASMLELPEVPEFRQFEPRVAPWSPLRPHLIPDWEVLHSLRDEGALGSWMPNEPQMNRNEVRMNVAERHHQQQRTQQKVPFVIVEAGAGAAVALACMAFWGRVGRSASRPSLRAWRPATRSACKRRGRICVN